MRYIHIYVLLLLVYPLQTVYSAGDDDHPASEGWECFSESEGEVIVVCSCANGGSSDNITDGNCQKCSSCTCGAGQIMVNGQCTWVSGNGDPGDNSDPNSPSGPTETPVPKTEQSCNEEFGVCTSRMSSRSENCFVGRLYSRAQHVLRGNACHGITPKGIPGSITYKYNAYLDCVNGVSGGELSNSSGNSATAGASVFVELTTTSSTGVTTTKYYPAGTSIAQACSSKMSTDEDTCVDDRNMCLEEVADQSNKIRRLTLESILGGINTNKVLNRTQNENALEIRSTPALVAARYARDNIIESELGLQTQNALILDRDQRFRSLNKHYSETDVMYMARMMFLRDLSHYYSETTMAVDEVFEDIFRKIQINYYKMLDELTINVWMARDTNSNVQEKNQALKYLDDFKSNNVWETTVDILDSMITTLPSSAIKGTGFDNIWIGAEALAKIRPMASNISVGISPTEDQ